jgi:hypothetical protein
MDNKDAKYIPQSEAEVRTSAKETSIEAKRPIIQAKEIYYLCHT